MTNVAWIGWRCSIASLPQGKWIRSSGRPAICCSPAARLPLGSLLSPTIFIDTLRGVICGGVVLEVVLRPSRIGDLKGVALLPTIRARLDRGRCNIKAALALFLAIDFEAVIAGLDHGRIALPILRKSHHQLGHA